MPVTVSYPGVYIEDVSSGVHTITGVATSIAAFLGRASKGPLDQAVRLLSRLTTHVPSAARIRRVSWRRAVECSSITLEPNVVLCGLPRAPPPP